MSWYDPKKKDSSFHRAIYIVKFALWNISPFHGHVYPWVKQTRKILFNNKGASTVSNLWFLFLPFGFLIGGAIVFAAGYKFLDWLL